MQVQEGDELTLFLVHKNIELYSPLTLVVVALLHLDDSCAHVFLDNYFNDEKIDGWFLDTNITHYMNE